MVIWSAYAVMLCAAITFKVCSMITMVIVWGLQMHVAYRFMVHKSVQLQRSAVFLYVKLPDRRKYIRSFEVTLAWLCTGNIRSNGRAVHIVGCSTVSWMDGHYSPYPRVVRLYVSGDYGMFHVGNSLFEHYAFSDSAADSYKTAWWCKIVSIHCIWISVPVVTMLRSASYLKFLQFKMLTLHI